MSDSITKLQEGIRERRDQQIAGLKKILTEAFESYKKKHNEYPALQTEQDVDNYIKSHSGVRYEIERLDLVLHEVAKVAFEVLDNLSHPS